MNLFTLINVVILLVANLVSHETIAAEIETTKKSIQSYGGVKQAFAERNNRLATKPKLKKNDYLGWPRHKLQQQRAAQFSTQQEKITSDVKRSARPVHVTFSIHRALSELLTDIDQDGYFQTFSVTFDADLSATHLNTSAIVFADLYLSVNGGPWELYFTTDNFEIVDDSSEDEFEVVTSLKSGYLPKHYDVLIDLYVVGVNGVVASISSDDTNALYALPLESADWDPEYVEVISEERHGGSISIGVLLLLAVGFMLRIKRARRGFSFCEKDYRS